MLGMGDFPTFLVYALCVLSALACVIYGVVNWNKGADLSKPEVEKEWQDTEKNITEELDI
ncbi:MAG: symporter small accessory protein [Christensenellales bacterium]